MFASGNLVTRIHMNPVRRSTIFIHDREKVNKSPIENCKNVTRSLHLAHIYLNENPLRVVMNKSSVLPFLLEVNV